MGKGLLFFCCACCILLLTIINLSIGPIVSYTEGSDWGTLNCAKEKDNYDNAKDLAKKANTEIPDDAKKYYYKYKIDRCERRKGMHDMEYTAFIFDIVIGFVCGLIGLLHLFELKKEFISNTGLIGLGCGVVGFVLTFVYVIFNGLVYTNYYTGEYKIDGDGAFAELEGNRYKCLYYDDKALNIHSFYAKYSDLIKSQYNYNYDLDKSFQEDYEKGNCTANSYITSCTSEYIPIQGPYYYYDNYGNRHICNKFYYHRNNEFTTYSNYDISARFLTVLLLSIVILLCYCGLIFFGFNLSKPPS